jgi:protein-tyrosine phosphatase
MLSGKQGDFALASLIKDTWASLEITKNGCERILNVWTDVVINADHSAYDDQKFKELLEEIKNYLKHYDRVSIESRFR